MIVQELSSLGGGLHSPSALVFFEIFAKKFENSKWPSFLAKQTFFEIWDGYYAEIPFGSKLSLKSLISHGF